MTEEDAAAAMGKNQLHEAVIIGAGPAGVAAAVQLKRSGIQPTVIERSAVGGAIREANLVENYPGFPEGIRGDEIARLLERHLEVYDIRPVRDEVIGITATGLGYRVKTERDSYEVRRVIVATGAKPKPLPDDIPAPLSSERLNYSLDSVRETKPKTVAIIGAGDIAFDYAASCSTFAERVLILGRRKKSRCVRILEKRASENPKIEILLDHPVTGISERHERPVGGTPERNGTLVIECASGELIVDEVLIAIGRVPNVNFLDGDLAGLHNAGRLDAGRGLFFAGDVIRGDRRQVAIAAGDGLRCALTILESCRALG
jgi:thioredoxin reductase